MELEQEEGRELAAITPGDADSSIRDVMDKDRTKLAALTDQVHAKAEKLKLTRQKSMEVRYGVGGGLGRERGREGAGGGSERESSHTHIPEIH